MPTFTAFATTNLLEHQFRRLVDTEFTAGMETVLDDIDRTIEYWHRWSERLSYDGPWSDEVRRSALEHGLSLLQKPVRPLALKSTLDRLRTMRQP